MYQVVGRTQTIEPASLGESHWRSQRMSVHGETDRTGSSSALRDAAVAERAERAVINKDFRFSRGVRCTCDHSVLVLSGRVPSYYLKQLAQAAVVTVEGVEQIENRIDGFVPATAPSGRR